MVHIIIVSFLINTTDLQNFRSASNLEAKHSTDKIFMSTQLSSLYCLFILLFVHVKYGFKISTRSNRLLCLPSIEVSCIKRLSLWLWHVSFPFFNQIGIVVVMLCYEYHMVTFRFSARESGYICNSKLLALPYDFRNKLLTSEQINSCREIINITLLMTVIEDYREVIYLGSRECIRFRPLLPPWKLALCPWNHMA